MRSYWLQVLSLPLVLLTLALAAPAEDLHIKKNISVNGNLVSSTDTSIQGARERNVSGNTITVRQCDLSRTLTINDATQTYYVANDPQDDAAARAAALVTGAPATESGGEIVITTSTTDTGERKTMFGYPARHLKTTVVEESSKDACSQVQQKYEIDGWYADLSKELSSCAHFVPPVREPENCHDRVVARHSGSGKPGYPLQESITMHNPDASATTVTVQTSEIAKQANLPAELFDIPAQYRQVSSPAELMAAQQTPAPAQLNPAQNPAAPLGKQLAGAAMNPQMAAMMGNQPASAPVEAPRPLGPKAAGKIRIGVAPPEAQLGQGNNAGADYSTPIRNAEIALMNGPAIEIAPLDSHIAMQLQSEAQQKQCDYIFYSSVAVKHGGGGFGKFMKMAAPMATMMPMAGMASGMGGAVAAQTAGMAASAAAQAAQQQAVGQLAGFNGQIKSKDDVSVEYQLVATGQTSPRLHNLLKAKAKSDGEDVLTPLLQQAATSVVSDAGRMQ